MADRLKGITLEIGGDTTKLSKSLSGVNSDIKTTQDKLKDVERLLKLDPTNVDLLRQKEKLLADEIGSTKDKLKQLKQASEQAANTSSNYDAWKKVYDPIQKEINSTTTELEKLKRQQKEMEFSGNVDATAYKELNDSIKETEKQLSSLKKQAKAVTEEFGHPVSSEQYDSLQREIAETEQNLKSLEEEYRNFGSVAGQQIAAVGEKMEEVGGKISAFGDKISGAGKKLMPVTGAIVGAGTLAFKEASDMAESVNKVEVAFGDASDRVMAFSETTLDTYGIAKGTALDMASLFGDMATSMGLVPDEAATLSEKLVGLSGDLASFKNVGVDQAAQALKGIFTGETESLKSLGVVMNETNLLQYAMEKGLIDTSKSYMQVRKEEFACRKAYDDYSKAVEKYGMWSLEAEEANIKLQEAEEKRNEAAKASLDTLSQEELVMLRYNYVMDATQNAQGDFARTSDGTANSMRIMQESVKEASAAFGELLLPIITPVIQKITELIKWLTNLDDGQKKSILSILGIAAAIGPVLIVIGNVVSAIGNITTGIGKVMEFLPKLSGMFSSVFSFIAANPIVLLIAAIVGLVAIIAAKGDEIQAVLQKVDDFMQGVFSKDWTEVFGPVLGNTLNAFFAVFSGIWDGVKQALDGIIDVIRGVFTGDWERVWTGVQEIFAGIFDGLEAEATAPLNGIIGFLNAIIDGANWCIDKLNQIPGVNLDTIGDIPFLARGGTVYSGSAVVGDAGPEILTVTGGKATVTPLTGSGAAGGPVQAASAQAIQTVVDICFNGSLSQLAAVLQPAIVAETRRIGGSFTR